MVYSIEKPANEKILSYALETKEREDLKSEIQKIKQKTVDVSLIIGGTQQKNC
jgi:hypothetical protein